ncbi:hypothetical protein MTR67_007335 [Solanum verrucosum]|uniref:Uncharacterized protein n=1 Tax=Solanum verrucosum TaxID=315347 RepID=A0AAF0Q359_SOLVR|nr:hypothetical protein MTR67_007335 [Solanum verrucosum]
MGSTFVELCFSKPSVLYNYREQEPNRRHSFHSVISLFLVAPLSVDHGHRTSCYELQLFKNSFLWAHVSLTMRSSNIVLLQNSEDVIH